MNRVVLEDGTVVRLPIKKGKSLELVKTVEKAGKFGLIEPELIALGFSTKSISVLVKNGCLIRTSVTRRFESSRESTIIIHYTAKEEFENTDIQELKSFVLKKKGAGGTLVDRKDVLDRWYTHDAIAKRLMDTFHAYAKDVDEYIEPSAGEGAFFTLFPEGKRKGYDLQPSENSHPEIMENDFFEIAYKDHEGEGVVAYIGNPPFGRMASLAVNFFNECAKNPRAKYIAFIVPKTFQKTSVQNKLSLDFRLIHEENIPYEAFTLFGEAKGVPSCFQIWMRTKFSKRKPVEVKKNIWFEEVTKEDAMSATEGVYFAIRRAGGRAGEVLEGLDHSSASTLFLKELKPGVKDALQEMSFLDVAEKTAGTRSVSKSELVLFLATTTI